MRWHDRELSTLGDMIDAIRVIDTKEEAAVFMALYSAENAHAEENIGYLAGYFDSRTKHRIFELFGVHHPFFGLMDPTPEQAFEMGQNMARRWTREAREKKEEPVARQRDRTVPKRLIEP